METQTLRAEPHLEIGSIIERRAEDILEQWCVRALKEQPTAQRVRSTVLRNHLGRFLRAVGRALASSEAGLTEQHWAPALEHGDQRWDTGWALSEVVRDYQLLRIVILEQLEEAMTRPLYVGETAALGVFIDDAIAASVGAYVKDRDEEARIAEQRRNEEFEAINRRKDEFLGILGHELRNPLAPIRTCVRVLQSQPGPLSPVVQTTLGVLDRQSHQLARLVDDLLDVSRIGQGQFELRKTPVKLAEVFAQAADAIAPVMADRGHTLRISPPDPALEVEADQDRLLQIVSNLLNNAAKYTESGGVITLAGEADDTGVIVRVRDNGIGIPAEKRQSIFDLFTQLDRGKDLAQGGLGIGLTLVRGLVEQHGGAISCESAGEGQGSEFIVRLPHAPGHILPPPASAERAHDREPPNLKIVLRREPPEDTAA